MKKVLFLLGVFYLFMQITYAQVKAKEILSKNSLGVPELINFTETKIKADKISVNTFLKKQFNLQTEDEYRRESKHNQFQDNLESRKYQQFYNGILVEYGIQNVVLQNNYLKTISGKYVKIIKLDTKPKLSEQDALKIALNKVGAKSYMWESTENKKFNKSEQKKLLLSYYPKGEVVIIEKNILKSNATPVLAYKFNIYASEPVSREFIYIDAQTGEIVFTNPIIKHIQGTGDTRYSGQRTFETQQVLPNQYKLRDYSRGQGIETYNLNRGTDYTSAVDFIDNDNNWTSAEHNNSNFDNAALDAHWGTQKTYDYFLLKHSRNSIDNLGAKLKSYVHFQNLYFNAFWNGQFMTYGDGNSNPLTTLDITAHEIGHGICEKTANLIYLNEPGAINEGLSDIWGAMVEHYAEPTKQTYLIGEEIGALRSMSNPKSYNHPNTYGGQYWYTGTGDAGGVHTNSGILNHWYYILSEGKIGTNDLGNVYNIIGIGKEKASKIVYRAETVYFTATTNYSQARDLTIQAAKDLYGNTSMESAYVCQSWYAVGVGNNNCIIPVIIDGSANICNSTTDYTYTASNVLSGSTISWTVSTNSLIKVSSTNTSVTVRPINSSYRGIATITANVAGNVYNKTIWIGLPNAVSRISGPSTVLSGALVNYSSTFTDGATSYEWTLPYPYDTVDTFNYFANNWSKLTNESSSNTIRVLTGYGQISGLVQVVGKNLCGCGGVKFIQVTHGTQTGPGGGAIPINGINNADNTLKETIKIYPNPANDILTIKLETKIFNVLLYDLVGKLIKEVKTDTNTLYIDTKNLQLGNYILVINQNNNTISKKIVINH